MAGRLAVGCVADSGGCGHPGRGTAEAFAREGRRSSRRTSTSKASKASTPTSASSTFARTRPWRALARARSGRSTFSSTALAFVHHGTVLHHFGR